MSKVGAVALSVAMVACSFVVMPAGEVKAAEADTSTGLIAHYSFEDSLSNEAKTDATATMNKGTAAYADGVNGKAFDFSANKGTSQLANAGAAIQLDAVPTTTAFSVSYWVKNADITGSTMMFFDGCCQYFQFGSNGEGAFPMARASMSSAWSWETVVGDHWRTGKSTQIADTWQMVTYTVSSTGKATTYLNGVAISEYWTEENYADDGWFAYTLDEGATYKNMFSDGGDWVDAGFIGSGDWWNANYAGLMDEVYIYERELTAADVAALYVADGPKTTSVSFAEDNVASVLAGQTATLTYTTAPNGAVDTPVITFASSNDKVATVDNTGKVTAVADGDVTITVTATVGDKTYTDTWEMKVTSEKNPITDIKATIDKNSFDLGDGSATTATVKVELTIENADKEPTDSKAVTFTSSDDKVATVDKDGKVTAVGKGTATITASLENGLKASVDVTVVKTIKITTEVDCTGWWKAHSTGVEVTKDGIELTFKNTTYADAKECWNGPIYVLYTGSEPLVNGDGYAEYAVMRGDLYGWTPTCNTNEADKWTAAGHTFTASGVDLSVEAEKAEFIKNLKAGVDCKVTAKIVNGGVQVKMTVGKAVSTATYKVDTTKPVYISVGGELCKLTKIEAKAMATAVKVPTAVTATEVSKVAEKLTFKGAPEGAKLEANVVSADEVKKVEGFKSTTLKGLTFQAIDLKLTKDNAEVKADGSVEVTMPVLESLKAAKQVNVYVVEGDALTLVSTVDVKDGMITFNAPHFSTYVFAAKLSGTADTAPIIPVVIVGCVAAAAVLVAKKRRVTE